MTTQGTTLAKNLLHWKFPSQTLDSHTYYTFPSPVTVTPGPLAPCKFSIQVCSFSLLPQACFTFTRSLINVQAYYLKEIVILSKDSSGNTFYEFKYLSGKNLECLPNANLLELKIKGNEVIMQNNGEWT